MASFAVKSRALIQELAALELIAAFEGGDDRASVLKKARKIWSEQIWDGLPRWLVTRLMQDRDGADVVIPTRVGVGLKVKDHAGWLADPEFEDERIQGFHFLVFDEQIAVLCSNNNASSPGLHVIYCSRSSAFEGCLPKMRENELSRAYCQRVCAWYQSPDSSIPVVTPTRVSCMGSGWGKLLDVEREAKFMDHIEALCQECGTHGLVACARRFLSRRFDNLAQQCFDDDAARRAAAQAAFQKLLLEGYIDMGLRLDDLPPVGAFRRRAVRGLLVRLRALVLQGRATCLRDGFLCEAAPARVFRLVVSFL